MYYPWGICGKFNDIGMISLVKNDKIKILPVLAVGESIII